MVFIIVLVRMASVSLYFVADRGRRVRRREWCEVLTVGACCAGECESESGVWSARDERREPVAWTAPLRDSKVFQNSPPKGPRRKASTPARFTVFQSLRSGDSYEVTFSGNDNIENITVLK